MLKRRARNELNSKKSKAKGVFVFFVGDDGAILCYMENGIVKRRLFSAEANNKASETLKELLREYPTAPIYMLVDMVEQSYVRHTLPPVSSLGVNKIIQRRLARDFAPDDLKGALSLGREKVGRKDWTFLLVSLAYKDSLRDWCEMVYDLPNRFKGVYLSPVESEGIMRLLAAGKERIQQEDLGEQKDKRASRIALKRQGRKKKDTDTGAIRWEVLVVHNKTGGFRQVVLKNGTLIFTRMAQNAGDEKPTVMAGNIEQEIHNTIEYLKRLSFTEASELMVTVIVGQEIKDHLSIDAFNAQRSTVYTPYEVAEILGITESVLSGDRFCDILLACSFLKLKKKRLKLLPTYTKKTETCYHSIKAILGVGGMLGIALLGFIGMNAMHIVSAESSLIDIAKQDTQLAARVNEFEEKAATFKVDPFIVDSLIKTHDLIGEKTTDFRDILYAIKPLISKSVVLQSFEWSLSALEDNAAANGTSSPVPFPTALDSVNGNIQNDRPQPQTKSVIIFDLYNEAENPDSFQNNSSEVLSYLKRRFKGYSVETSDSSAATSASKADELSINFEVENAGTQIQNPTQPLMVTLIGAGIPIEESAKKRDASSQAAPQETEPKP
jgi:hypothetical protein